MRKVNIHEAKTHLSRLVDGAAKGEPFIIAKAGKPLVKVLPIEPEERGATWLGSMRDADWCVPDTVEAFDSDQEDIVRLFEGDEA